MSRVFDDIKNGEGLFPLFVESSKDSAAYPDVLPKLINKIEYVLCPKMLVSKEELSIVRDEFVRQLKEGGVAFVPHWIDVNIVQIPIAFIQEDGTITRF